MTLLGWARDTPTTVQDAFLAVALCVLDLVLFSDVLSGTTTTETVSEIVIVAYAAAGYVALIWRRRAPVQVFVALWLHAMLAAQIPRYGPTIGLLVALYTVAATCSTMISNLALLAALLRAGLAVADELATIEDRSLGVLLGTAMFFVLLNVGVWVIGRWVRASRQRTARLEQLRQIDAKEAVTAERARIARELHDIVSHSVTVMVLQAGGARRVLQRDTARVEEALAQIEAVGTQAMGELRRMLGVLREADVGYGGGRQPSIADLDDLLEGMRRAGVSVELTTEGYPKQLDASVSLTAYRVVQEALTNVTKHAGPDANAAVRVVWGDDLVVQISDDGHGKTRLTTSSLSTGHGLLGLRERAAVAGGHLAAKPTVNGGFQVTATLPTGRSPQLTPRVKSEVTEHWVEPA